MSTWQILSSFPTAVPTVLLGILVIYWVLSIIGLVDIGDNLEIDGGDGWHLDAGHHHELDVHHDGTDIHTLAGYLVAMGLGGVPFSIVASLLVFFTWLGTALLHQYCIAQVPTAMLQMLFGAGALLLSAVISIPVSAQLIKPMRGLFVKHNARNNRSLVGLRCKIVTQTVDEKFGRAEVENHGASLNIRVWAKTPNALAKNSLAVILSYDETSQQYEVQALPTAL